MEPKEKCSHDLNKEFWSKYPDDKAHTIANKVDFKECPFCEQPAVRLGSIKRCEADIYGEAQYMPSGNFILYSDHLAEIEKEKKLAGMNALHIAAAHESQRIAEIKQEHLAEIKELQEQKKAYSDGEEAAFKKIEALEAEIKTRDDEIQRLELILKKHHDYDRKEVLAAGLKGITHPHYARVHAMDRVVELESKLAEMKALLKTKGYLDQVWKKNDELKAEKAKSGKLVKVLKKYGQHYKECNKFITYEQDWECTCGFDQAIAEAEGKTHEE